ncbi:MAG: hypothetical protein AB8B72_03705 [Crocinitomicaceae bacterium]
MKNYIVILLIILCSNYSGYSQNHEIAVETGYNRIGVFVNPHVGIDINNHQIHMGFKIYGYNLFFESSRIGPQIGYQYHFNTVADKFFFYPSLSYAAYREQKSNSNLLLSEINLKYGLGYNLGKNVALVNEVGVGYIMSNTNLFNELNTIKSAYPSFEISLGLVFHINHSTAK